MRCKLYVLATAILIASGTASSALGLLAPGPALPGNTYTGGFGPGTTPIAPGPATGSLIEQEGFGGVPLAIGSNDPSLPAAHRSAKSHLRAR
jgi:hypothetical protein